MGIVAAAAAAGIAISAAQHPTGHGPTPPTAGPSADPTPIPGGPIAGIGFTVADDPSSGQVVLFGGVANDDNTWLWNRTRWSLARPSVSPPGRIDASAAYDPQIRQVLLFGGRHAPFSGGPSLNDTWAWDGKTWRQLDTGAGGPTPGEGSSMAWDGALNEMVLVTSGGAAQSSDSTWIWNNPHWRLAVRGSVAPGAFDLPMAFDPITRSLIAEGCCRSPASPLGALDTTWRWDGTRWLQLSKTAEPLFGSYLALDPKLGRLVLCDCGPMLALPALASWNGQAWDLLPIAHVPIAPVAEITDSTTGQLLIFGSATPSNQLVAQSIHLWTLTGATWHQLDVHSGPT